MPVRSWLSKSRVPAVHVPEDPIFGRRLEPNEIRVLKVLPAGDGGALHCTLWRHELTEEWPHYVALSYCWGSSSLSKQILCNGMPLNITESLYAALWQSRESGDKEHLWADAICINQLDDVEKTEQVRQMARIYKYARSVRIWIGEKRTEDVAGLALIDKLNDIQAKRDLDFMTSANENLDLPAHSLPSFEGPAWVSMFGILGRPWFHRKWIIQEASVNQLVILRCGDVDVNFYNVLRAGTCIFYNNVFLFAQSIFLRLDISQPLESPIMKLMVIKSEILQRKYCPLLKGLSFTRNFHAQDPRDSYFALIGLAQNSDQRLVDYRKTLREVIMDVSIALMEDSGSTEDDADSPIHIISWSNGKDNDETGLRLPSWVPDFSRPQTRDPPISLWLFKENHEQPTLQLGNPEWRVATHEKSFTKDSLTRLFSRESKKHISFHRLPDEAKESLISKGRHYDSITKISRLATLVSPGEFNPPQMFSRELEFFAEVFDLVSEACPTLTLNQIERKAWRTLCCGNRFVTQGLTEADWDSFQAALEFLNYACIIKGFPIPTYLDRVPKIYSDRANFTLFNASQEAATYFIRTSNSIRLRRRLFITQNGRVGMAPAETQPGDQVFFFLGSRFPLILRPVTIDFKVRFELVGDCYLDGFMDGEAHDDLSGFEQVEII